MQHTKTILIIEDEDELRQSIVEILKFEGFAVIEAATGEKGIELLTNKEPDLILCDIMLPDIEGYDILDTYNQLDKPKDIPFIFITALFDREHFRQGMEKGADDYLVKPFNRIELLKSITTQWDKINAIKTNVAADSPSNSNEEGGVFLINDLSSKEKDKISSLVEEALNALETSNSIHDLISKIDKELKNALLTSEQRKVLQAIKNQVSTNKSSRKELTIFLLKFNLIYPNFISNLKKKHQQLSVNDVFLSSATLMGLDTNQIANMMHISEGSVRKNRYRLKKRLGLSKESDFYTYIHTYIVAD